MPSKRSTSPAKHEGVAGAQLLDEVFLDLAQHAAAGQGALPRLAAARRPTRRTLIIGASTMVPAFMPVLLREARMGDAQRAVRASASGVA